MASFTNTWDETIPLDDSTTGLSEAGKIDALVRQLKLDIRERITKFMPPGMIIKWSSAIIPYGFMELNGASLLRANYPALFTVLGTYYGTADSLHFNIPNWAKRYPRGWNNGKSSGIYDPNASTRTKVTAAGATMSAGDHVGTEESGAIKLHNHEYYYTKDGSVVKQYTPGFTYAITQSNIGSSGGEESKPKSVYKKYIIRVDDYNPLDGTYSYERPWDEAIPVNSNYYGRMSLEIRKLREDVESLINNFFPPGMEIFWPGSSAPDGYLEENGQAVSRTTYAELFDTIGDLYGDGDGETTFNVPDARGLFIRADDGLNLGEIEEDDNLNHYHTGWQTPVFNIFFDQWASTSGSAFLPIPAICNIQTSSGNSPSRTVDGHPKNIYLMPCIKAKACA